MNDKPKMFVEANPSPGPSTWLAQVRLSSGWPVALYRLDGKLRISACTGFCCDEMVAGKYSAREIVLTLRNAFPGVPYDELVEAVEMLLTVGELL